MNNSRQFLEGQIIGNCLLSEVSAIKACDILRPINFQDEFIRKVFTVIHNHVGVEPVSFSHIVRSYNQTFSDKKYYEFTTYIHECAGDEIQGLCLALLEIDMREKFTQLLAIKERTYAKAQEFEKAAVMKQLHDHVSNMSIDVFEAIDQAYRYASEYLQEDIEDIRLIIESIPKLAQRIKSRNKTHRLMDTLENLAKADSRSIRQECLITLKDAFITALYEKEIPESILKATAILQQSFYEPK